MNRAVKPHAHHLRYAARVVAIRLVDLRLQHRLHVPCLDTDHRQLCFGESAVKPLRQWPGFQSNSLEAVGRILQHRQQCFRLAGNLHFPNDLAGVIHNANAGLLDRNIQSSKLVHTALLLLMLETVHTDLVPPISLKRGTQKSSAIHKPPADYPIFAPKATKVLHRRELTRWANLRHRCLTRSPRPRSRAVSAGSLSRALWPS